jgi:hypothetical protein
MNSVTPPPPPPPPPTTTTTTTTTTTEMNENEKHSTQAQYQTMIENAIMRLEKIFDVNRDDIPRTNIAINVELIPKEQDNFEWTDISSSPSYLIGEDVKLYSLLDTHPRSILLSTAFVVHFLE